MNTRHSRELKDMVVLVGFNSRGLPISEQKLSVHDYYDEEHEIIDEPEFRRDRGIVRLLITFHGTKGEVQRREQMHYAADGKPIRREVL